MFVSFTGRYPRLSVHELPQNDKLIVYDPANESTFKKMEKQKSKIVQKRWCVEPFLFLGA